ncbi:MAG: hypothetical protein HRT36_06305 [Alphaproteobacteria bacterium]|nr:hypothetical protein [Alphaproteobacteria bacterium]
MIGTIALVAVGCSTPERGESELAYKNRLAKYTIAGILIGGYFGTHYAKMSSPLPLRFIGFGQASDKRAFLALFYAALGGYAGHSVVQYEGEAQRLLFELQQQLSSTAHEALVAEEVGETYKWSMPEQNALGEFKVTERYIGSQGFACQDLLAEITVGDVRENVQQTACQNAAGQWVLWTQR